jgi:choline dehydrogenase-like flavoprotein
MAAMLYRLHAEDFEAASRFGAPAGSTLIDWPIPYDYLRPYYDRVQELLGLSGATGANPFDPPADPYPQAPLVAHSSAAAVDAAARALGLHPFPTPRGILTAPRDGRSACVACGYCGAYACPVGAKASTVDTFLAKAEATGRCRVVPGVAVIEIVEDRAGRARSVVVADRSGGRHAIEAEWIVLAASAVETPRLLLLSRSARSPQGLGNGSAQVGKNLVLSLEAAGRARFPFPSRLFPPEEDARLFLNRTVQDRYLDTGAPGPYPKVGTLVFERVHFNPIQRARRVARVGDVKVGSPLAARLEEALRHERQIAYESFVEMLPRPGAHVRLDEQVTDASGHPSARIAVDDFPGERERTLRMASLAKEVLGRLEPEGITEDTALSRTYFLQAGTCRMGKDPGSSVCDPRGRVHGVERLVVCDGSALPSMGGVPPTLTIMANALRIAELILADR